MNKTWAGTVIISYYSVPLSGVNFTLY